VGSRFNPPPGWPVPYGFEPPPGWEPDPAWPPAPPNWPLWMGGDASQSGYHDGPRDTYTARYSGEPGGIRPAAPQAYPQDYPAQANGYTSSPPTRTGRGPRGPSLIKRLAGVLVSLIVAIVVISLMNRSSSSGPSTGKAQRNGQVSFFNLRTGACFQNPPNNELLRGLTVDVAAVPCRTAHNAQIFAQFRATGGVTYPGRAPLARQSADFCRSTLAVKVKRSKVNRKTLVSYLFPDKTSWFTGRRTISCLVIDSARDLTTSVLRARPAG
jgi:hypothetical protein